MGKPLPTGSLEEVLAHFGVKGMHWGVRKKSSMPDGKASEDASNATRALEKSKTGGIHTLSNKELQDLVTRMNLEQQLDKLKPPTKGDAAKKFIAELLRDVAKQEVKNLAKKGITEGVKLAFEAAKK